MLEEKDLMLKKKFFENGSGRICGVCHGGDEAFDPASLHCSLCGVMIAPNARYFVDASLQSVVCCTCFAALPGKGNGLSKSSLFLRDNKEVSFEKVAISRHSQF